MRVLGVLFISLIFAASCSEEARKNSLPRNSGSLGEMCVVAPSEFWKLSDGDAFKKSMNIIMYGLPQAELKMKRIEVDEQGFNSHFKTHRNVMKIELHPKKETQVRVRRNVHAGDQVFVSVYLQKQEDIHQIIDTRLDDIVDLFHDAEVRRLIDRNKAFGDKGLNKKVAELTGLNMVIQKDFEVAIESKYFTWLRIDMTKPVGGYQHSIKQGLMIYQRPYSDTAQFSDSSLLAWKDSVNRRFVKGPKDSQMSISDRFLLPKSKYITYQEQTAKEIRGLWRMDGYFMGGPFYSLAFFNPENGMQYMVEGYAYAPQFDKIGYIREIEAMVKSAVPVPKNDEG